MTKRTTPGLRRLRASPAAEAIRSAVLDDQRNGRAKALAKIEAQKAAAAAAIDLPAGFVIGRAPHLPAGGPSPIAAPGDARPPAKRRPRPALRSPSRPSSAASPSSPRPVPTPAKSIPGQGAAAALMRSHLRVKQV